MIGEIGGDVEEQTTEYVKNHLNKPVKGFIAGALLEIHQPKFFTYCCLIRGPSGPLL